MDWDKLRIFNAAADAGSFTNAGDLLNLSQSAVSRQINALEQSLKTSLFHRHARGLKLTEQGELLHRAAREVFARVSMAEALLAEQRDCPRGALKISTTVGFGTLWLVPRLKEFHELYPEITLSVIFDGGTADLSMREADVAVTTSAPWKPELVQRRIMSFRSYAYAAPEYLKKHGVPTFDHDLDQHRLVVQGEDGANDDWLLTAGANGRGPRRPIATLNNVYGVYRAVLSGLGIGALPHFMSPQSAGLVRLLPGCASAKSDGYFVYAAELRHSQRIAAFRDFLLRKIAESRLDSDQIDEPAGAEAPRQRSIVSVAHTGSTAARAKPAIAEWVRSADL